LPGTTSKLVTGRELVNASQCFPILSFLVSVSLALPPQVAHNRRDKLNLKKQKIRPQIVPFWEIIFPQIFNELLYLFSPRTNYYSS
jgi:hypothetical protein